MKRWFMIVLSAAVLAAAPIRVGAQSPAAAWFDRLKGLAGTWQGKLSDGGETVVSYRVASAGTAVIETIGEEGTGMVSVYTVDGNRILMTHYCSAGNQPRMAAKVTSADQKTLTFEFLDITNLSSPEAMHIHGLAMTWVDADHVTNVWTHRAGGKDGALEFALTRKK